MKRYIHHQLEQWKGKPDRKPLIVRGTRQVGKTFVVPPASRDNILAKRSRGFESPDSLSPYVRSRRIEGYRILHHVEIVDHIESSCAIFLPLHAARVIVFKNAS